MIAKQLYFMENTLRVLQNVPKKIEYKLFFAEKLLLKVRERPLSLTGNITDISSKRDCGGAKCKTCQNFPVSSLSFLKYQILWTNDVAIALKI